MPTISGLWVENKMKPSARHNAREYALQALYEWLLSNNNPNNIELHFLETMDPTTVDIEYFKKLLHGTIQEANQSDEYMKPYLDRSTQGLDPITLSVMRLAIFELAKHQDIPYRVVINEALELTKKFGATDAYKYVNGILDKVSKDLRKEETA